MTRRTPAASLPLVIITILGLLSVLNRAPTFAQAGVWQSRAPLPLPRVSHTGGVIDGKVYVATGVVFTSPSTGSVSNTLLIYNPATNSWSDGPPAPTPRGLANAVAINGRLYVAGGLGTTALEIFNPSTGLWSTGPNVPTARDNTAGAALNGRLYIVGPTPVVNVYDPVASTWTTAPALPTPRHVPTAAAINGKLYVIGGFNAAIGAYVNTVEVFDPATNLWSTGPAAPTARGYTTSAVFNERIHVIGGTSAAHEAYDPFTNSWMTLAPVPETLGTALASAVGAQLLAIGGNLNAAVYGYVPVPGTDSWASTASMSRVRYEHTLTRLSDGRVLAASGNSDDGPYNSTAELFHPESETWTATGNVIVARREATAVLLPNG